MLALGLGKVLFAKQNINLLDMSGSHQNLVHSLDIAKDIATSTCDMRLSPGNIREGLEDREGRGRVLNGIPWSGRWFTFDASADVAKHLCHLAFSTRQSLDQDVERLGSISAVIAGYNYTLVRLSLTNVVCHAGLLI
jgi:hypothetical protein